MLAIFYIVTNRAAEAEPYLKTIAETTKDVGASLALADYYVGTKRVPQAIALLEKLSANKAAYAAAKTRIATLQYAEKQAARGPQDDRRGAGEGAEERRRAARQGAVPAAGEPDGRGADAGRRRPSRPTRARPRRTTCSASSTSAKNNPDQAQAEFNEVLKINPRADAAQLQIARLELAKGERAGRRAVRRTGGDERSRATRSPG